MLGIIVELFIRLNLTTMIMIIILTLAFLVGLNFFLLIFSCNKISKKERYESNQNVENALSKKITSRKIVTTQLPSSHLAPTGS